MIIEKDVIAIAHSNCESKERVKFMAQLLEKHPFPQCSVLQYGHGNWHLCW